MKKYEVRSKKDLIKSFVTFEEAKDFIQNYFVNLENKGSDINIDFEIKEIDLKTMQDEIEESVSWVVNNCLIDLDNPYTRIIDTFRRLVDLNAYWNHREKIKIKDKHYSPVFNSDMELINYYLNDYSVKRSNMFSFLRFATKDSCKNFCERYKNLLIEYYNNILR